ncbi:TolC family protein [Flavobacterium aciduliphilum]|uniref:Outer membrane protein TolC n=1 Tax=Flavobacterium aciduliphilum TaxID=1101402 RepID=A0A328YA45_9FLAO|nr:TolC family protein [Flavobacterium aciduliphilum]RAR70799.1 outer membrane protein TolC [Flavobacterium aciduliphilum]
MKTTKIFLLALMALSSQVVLSQTKKVLSLKEAIALVLTNSHEALLANTKIKTAALELETLKNNQYPNLKASGQYLRLSNANVKSNFGGGNGMDVSQLMLGQINASMPVFSGFKLKNSIQASENMVKSQTASSAHTKEQLALDVVELFATLYKSQEMIELFTENLKSAQQRTKDFSAMVDNGLMARNDLLKAQLQESNVQLSLDNALKNTSIINYQLVTLLQLPENTTIEIDINAVKKDMAANQLQKNEGTRQDVEALQYQKQASDIGIKIARAGYFPSFALTGGYIALDLKNTLTVTNAMNFGVGLNYDFTSLLKNKKEVALAKSKAEQTTQALAILSDKIKEESQQAEEDYAFSLKQNKVYALAATQAEENYRIVKDKYDNNLATTNDLLEADVQQLQSKINLALSQADIALKYYNLQFASGKLINSFNLSTK